MGLFSGGESAFQLLVLERREKASDLRALRNAEGEQVMAREQGRGAELSGRDAPPALADAVVLGEVAVSGEFVHAVELEEHFKDRLAGEPFECRVAHLQGVAEAHVLRDEGDGVLADFAGETQPVEDLARHGRAGAVVTVEADAVSHSVGDGLADVVEQGGEGEFKGG